MEEDDELDEEEDVPEDELEEEDEADGVRGGETELLVLCRLGVGGVGCDLLVNEEVRVDLDELEVGGVGRGCSGGGFALGDLVAGGLASKSSANAINPLVFKDGF